VTLYQRVLGDRFDLLAPALRRFHSSPAGGRGRGVFKVIRPPGLLGTLLGLPPAGDDVPMTLVVRGTPRGEKWVRTFAGIPVVTHQWCEGGLLMERSGPVTFGFALDVVGGGLAFRRVRALAVGVPLPAWLAPSAEALASPTDSGWHVSVRLSLPFLGPFLGYEGKVIPEWIPPSGC
jgi:hypothetical protein